MKIFPRNSINDFNEYYLKNELRINKYMFKLLSDAMKQEIIPDEVIFFQIGSTAIKAKELKPFYEEKMQDIMKTFVEYECYELAGKCATVLSIYRLRLLEEKLNIKLG